jgi:Protein of unknown function (DUF1579)
MRINLLLGHEKQGERRLRIRTGIRCASVALLVMGFTATSTHAQDNALEKFVGRWDVRVRTLQPQKPDLSYVETYEWMLDRKFVRARTEGKSDGTEDMVVIGYDQKVNGYPFWIFSSSGTFLYLTPGSWDARNRTMEWKSPPLLDVSYQARCTLDDNTRRCTLVLKNWLGKVLLEQESIAVRRND